MEITPRTANGSTYRVGFPGGIVVDSKFAAGFTSQLCLDEMLDWPCGPVCIDLARSEAILSVGAPLMNGWGSPDAIVCRRSELTLIQAERLGSDTAAVADVWLPIRPGSEVAFLLMDNRFAFGLWICLDLTVIALGAGAFFTGFLLYILKRRELKAVLNSAVVLGFICCSGAVANLMVDVGQPLRARLTFWHPNTYSMLTEVTFCITSYLTLDVLPVHPLSSCGRAVGDILRAMKVYFCGAIAAGRQDLPAYQHIVGRLKQRGHCVLTEHVADPEVLDRERAMTPRRVYERDSEWMRTAEIVIAEVSTPSLGVGYEIACALLAGKPALCLYRDGLEISKMITGNTSPALTLAVWASLADLDRHIDSFLAAIAQSPEPGNRSAEPMRCEIRRAARA